MTLIRQRMQCIDKLMRLNINWKILQLQSIHMMNSHCKLLLSFLALSIPMLNAILSPEFTNNTKIISFVILLSLPLFYFSIIQIVKIRKKRTNKKKDLLRRKEGVLRNLEANRFDLEQVIDDHEMSEDSKNNAIELLNLNINTMEKFLKRFDGKL